ncbi:MAG: B12-binding domain-containing radical SAM protein [Myxococcota bacterium]
MKRVLLTTPYAPFDVAWGEDTMDLMNARLARGHGQFIAKSQLPTWGLYLIAENIDNPATVLEYPHWDDFVRELHKGYDVIAIQLKSLNTRRVVEMVKAIRRCSPRSEIVLGGYGVSALNDPMPGDTEGKAQFLQDHVDHMCRDEGVRYMRRLLGDSCPDRAITQYHLPHARYTIPGMRGLDVKIPAILVALGCPSACNFCNTSAFYRHKKIYVAEPEQTYAFMKHHQETLGAESMHTILFDEDIFLDAEYVRELGRLIRSDRKTWGIRWISFGSINALSEFTPEELRECGVGGIWIGVESGMKDDGKKSKTGFAKREAGSDAPEVFEAMNQHGIETIGSMILGFDFHTPENVEQDIDYFVGLKPVFYQVGPLTPCPGTTLYRQLYRDGRILPHYDFEHFHLWKDDVFDHTHFGPGEIKKFYDLTHEKLRTVNGPPVIQFCELNLNAYETFLHSDSEFLRFQAEQAKDMAIGALPICRVIRYHAPSPQVLERIKGLEARAHRLFGDVPLRSKVLGKAIEAYAHWRAEHSDPLDRAPVVSDPGVRWAHYNVPGRTEPIRRLPLVEQVTARLRFLLGARPATAPTDFTGATSPTQAPPRKRHLTLAI